MASQTVPADKRYRISLLLDAYSELLTEKQRTFLRHYFEEDLSFGEIAKEYGVSRQAIFDSVKHGEESLENFERVLKLVANGWARWVAAGRTAEALIGRVEAIRARLERAETDGALGDLDLLLAELRGEIADDESDGADEELDENANLNDPLEAELTPVARGAEPAMGGDGTSNV